MYFVAVILMTVILILFARKDYCNIVQKYISRFWNTKKIEIDYLRFAVRRRTVSEYRSDARKRRPVMRLMSNCGDREIPAARQRVTALGPGRRFRAEGTAGGGAAAQSFRESSRRRSGIDPPPPPTGGLSSGARAQKSVRTERGRETRPCDRFFHALTSLSRRINIIYYHFSDHKNNKCVYYMYYINIKN